MESWRMSAFLKDTSAHDISPIHSVLFQYEGKRMLSLPVIKALLRGGGGN